MACPWLTQKGLHEGVEGSEPGTVPLPHIDSSIRHTDSSDMLPPCNRNYGVIYLSFSVSFSLSFLLPFFLYINFSWLFLYFYLLSILFPCLFCCLFLCFTLSHNHRIILLYILFSLKNEENGNSTLVHVILIVLFR